MRRRRRALDLTQAELAAQAGCTESMLRKIEADARRPSAQLAERLAQILAPAAETAPAAPVHALPAAAPMWWHLSRSAELPEQPTAFIGRETERLVLRLLLRRDDVRLVTLTGPGGAGKTRLALQIAAELKADFPDGVVFVPLASVADAARVMPTVALACGVIEHGDWAAAPSGARPLLARLAQTLRNRRVLLLLDNVEHLLAAAPEIASLLAATTALKIIVTSRARLHLTWEHDFAVPPLALPTPGMQPALEQLAQFDAVRLFLARAQAVDATIVLTAENADVVIEICRRLDALPLAIELATARCRYFTPQALLARLDSRLTLLTSGPRDAPERQQTLRGLIDWSYALLEPREQRLLARLGVFANGCSLAAAEAVCVEPGETAASLLDSLLSLVDKSVIQQTRGVAGEPRFVLLETIREYALERLQASGEQHAVQSAHVAFFFRLAETAASALEGAEQSRWLARLRQEHDNLRVALAWMIEQRDAERGIRLAVALRLFWFMRGYLAEGRDALVQLLALPNLATQDRARGLDCAGFLARYQGDYDAAAVLIQESLAIWRTSAYGQGIADALSNLGYVRLHQGDTSAARALYRESLSLNRACANQQGIADCLSHLGTVSFIEGDLSAAATLYREALAVWELLGDQEGVAYAQYHLGDVALAHGQSASAAGWFAASLSTAVELEWPLAIVSTVEGAVALAVGRGKLVTATHLAAFAGQARETGSIRASADRAQLIEQRLAPARETQGDQAFAACWAEGALLTSEQAIALARHEFAAAAAHSDTAQRHSGTAAADMSPGGLTAREQDVARLLAQGRSNREIAAELVVGVKTVEAHTSRILAKLGFSSRAQIAVWAVQHGLSGTPED